MALEVPEDKFLLISIFGEAFQNVEVAKILRPMEMGSSSTCPAHMRKATVWRWSDPDLVREIVSAVKEAVDIPVVAKLTPTVPNIADIAAAAIQGGADGLCAINTMGPECYESHGHPVLTNGSGGVSCKIFCQEHWNVCAK